MGPLGWEYKLVLMGNPFQADVEERANALGRLGWELVGTDAGVWIFKRPTELVQGRMWRKPSWSRPYPSPQPKQKRRFISSREWTI